MNDLRYMPMKRKFLLAMKLREILVEKFWWVHLSCFRRFSYTRRVRNTAVKNEQMIPMMRVVAKPRMGPVPNT